MRKRTEKYRKVKPSPTEDYRIGCILLTQPFFFEEGDWISIPPDFSLNIVQGKTYDLTKGHGRRLWEKVLLSLESRGQLLRKRKEIAEPEERYGTPTLVVPRLGQGGFRVVVTDAYDRRCAVTQEKTLPALEAAHIKPFSESGPHRVQNGILLRSDIHRLFDAGYVTVTTDHHFEVSRRVHAEFDNGKHYYSFHGKRIHVPLESSLKPSSEFLDWHNEHVFRG